MAMYRCAACGSSHVVADSKKEGFSVGKGIAGTALFGAVGAIMGVNGKTQMYYHCASCGQTLSYVMSDTQKFVIDNAIAHSDIFGQQLPKLKMEFPNIEWDSSQVLADNDFEDDKFFLEPSEVEEKVWNYYTKTQIPYIEADQLFKATLGEKYILSGSKLREAPTAF